MKPAREHSLLIGQSSVMIRLRELALQVAETDITVLITGETGSGKEVLARYIHEHSRRSTNNFIPVNCGAIPSGLLESELFGHEKGSFTGAVQARKGYFESADRGTIFLDEIGEMPPETQVKFLRVLETGEFQRVGASRAIYSDARIIAATNRNLYQEVAENRFREDLYYRLRSVELQLPPLRERGRDILVLTEHFVREAEQRNGIAFEGFDAEAADMLLRYPWPGNIRELRNLIDSLLVLEKGRKITSGILEKHLIQRSRHKSLVHDPSRSEKQELNLIYSSIIQLRQEMSEIRHLLQLLLHNRPQPSPLLLPGPASQTAAQTQEPPAARTETGAAEKQATSPSLGDIEKQTIIDTLKANGNNKRLTAKTLGITERTLYRKIKSYGIGN
ncbi:MAG: sigma-54 dependent transcriptional regulator [Chlorobium sp.]|uniref:sigma-54 interaction domain-containing protein n=1 Tax=Chlorobium sp. TaxID=1095 RepID=UPI002F42C5BF